MNLKGIKLNFLELKSENTHKSGRNNISSPHYALRLHETVPEVHADASVVEDHGGDEGQDTVTVVGRLWSRWHVGSGSLEENILLQWSTPIQLINKLINSFNLTSSICFQVLF